MNQSFSLLQEWGFITPHGLRQELWKFNFFLTTFHSTVERCPLWLCGVLAQIVVLRQAVSSCNFSVSSTFSFLCTSFFFLSHFISSVALSLFLGVTVSCIFTLWNKRRYLWVLHWNHTVKVYSLCLCSLFHDHVCMFIANVCSFRLL